ncbi:RnfABCDGE type electron transport complex subunit G [Azoarcus sp. DN11]|uniref:RnfABCDGE type electron transport complex subunit G n=1 Tax=Azoarcus sp. DN11 TaxID=356837 RepID=UPI000EAD420E|nr:RnfABCDGE type electron transport complex subunit G [Azoarcus sp. DN11]AYH44355.1 electron transporter RnfG [Azoarcus sp. DN11]
MSARDTAARTSLRTAGILVMFTVVFTALMSATFEVTRPTIEASAQEGKMRLINEVLPRVSYDNALLDDFVTLGPTPELGLDEGGRIYRARKAGEPAALVLEVIAPDGYAGRIQMAVAVGADGRVNGVRVTGHRETPGLGDYIDPRKDRNKSQPWIGQFAGVSFADIGLDKWKVGRDGGVFASRTGATISARAVTNAAARAADYAIRHRDALFAAHAGGRL